MVTAQDITDDQIRELQRKLIDHPDFGVSFEIQGMLRACSVALEYEAMCWTRDARAARARALCADNYNAGPPPVMGPCPACREIAVSVISYQEHTCDEPRAPQPTGHNP